MTTATKEISSETKKLLADITGLGNHNEFNQKACKYYETDEFVAINGKNNSLSFLHLNIASLNKHFDELSSYLDTLKHNFGFIGITETRFLKDSSKLFNCDLPNYKSIHTPTESSVGGVLLYISEKFIFKPREDLSSLLYNSRELESVFIELTLKNKKNIIVGCVYRHPSMSENEFTNKFLSPFLEKTCKENKKLIVLGDFNIDLLKFENSSSVSDFIDLTSSYNMSPQILLPTRVTETSKTLIDNIFINSLESTVTAGNLYNCISDHLPQFLFMHNTTGKENLITQLFERNWSCFTENDFIKDFSKINWDKLIQDGSINIDYSFDSFMNSVEGLLDKHAPFVKLTKKQTVNRSKPWLNADIIKTIQLRDKLFKLFLKTRDPVLKSLVRNHYKITRNRVVNLIRRNKRSYYSNYFKENSKNMRKTWQGINLLISTKQNKQKSPTELNINNNIITDPFIMANTFNDRFTNIAQEIRSTIPSSQTAFHSYLKTPNRNSFFLSPTTVAEVYDCISKLSKNKGYGPCSIPIRVLKLVQSMISKPLTKLINLSFTLGSFPLSLKTAKVIPIHKKGCQNDPNNYRPISLLSNIDKIFESLMYRRLLKFLNQFNIIYRRQFGFRKNHSTTHALLNLTEEIRQALDKGNFACGVFVDLQKAFDTVDHEILLYKLSYYGIRGLPNAWFRSYLTGRSQYVFLNGHKSTIKPILHGVPQGSVLGPLLFLLYINDIYNTISFSTVSLFADDTNLFQTHHNLKFLSEKINIDLCNLNIWLNANKISLNANKTQYLLFKHKRKYLDFNFSLEINGMAIAPSSFIKYLGLYLDEDLKFRYHIDNMSSKLRKANGALCKVRHFVPSTVLKNIYYALFESIMTYALVVWGQNPNSNCKRISILQKCAVRIMSFASPRTHSNPLFKQLGVIKLSDQIQCNNIILIHQILNNKIPQQLITTFALVFNNPFYSTRVSQSLDFCVPHYNTFSFGKFSVKHQCLESWHSFKLKFPDINLAKISLHRLSSLVRRSFLDSY